MDRDRVERLCPDGGEEVWRIGSDDDDVAGTGNDLFPRTEGTESQGEGS